MKTFILLVVGLIARTQAVSNCPAGETGQPAGASPTSCVPCATNTFKTATTTAACTAQPLTACTGGNAGKLLRLGGKTAANTCVTQCAAGQTGSPANTPTSCVDCGAGTFKAAAGNGACGNEQHTSSSCVNAAGARKTFTDTGLAAANTCALSGCDAGYTGNPASGTATSCVACAANTFKALTTFVACGADTVTSANCQSTGNEIKTFTNGNKVAASTCQLTGCAKGFKGNQANSPTSCVNCPGTKYKDATTLADCQDQNSITTCTTDPGKTEFVAGLAVAANKCQSKTQCAAGTGYKAAVGSTAESCVACTAGKFNVGGAGNRDCVTDPGCPKGKKVGTPGSLTAATQCVADSAVTVTTCPAGQKFTAAVTGANAAPAFCTFCAAGTFNAADDNSPRCNNQKQSCGKGKKFVAAAAGGVADHTCSNCAAGTYNDAIDKSDKCITQYVCPKGEKVQTAGSEIAKTVCVHDSTVTVTTCPKGQKFTAAVTGANAAPAKCAHCADGEYNAADDNSGTCTTQVTCPADKVVDVAGDKTKATTCKDKPAPVTTCDKGKYFVKADATNNTPAKCEACAANKFNDKNDTSDKCTDHTKCKSNEKKDPKVTADASTNVKCIINSATTSAIGVLGITLSFMMV